MPLFDDTSGASDELAKFETALEDATAALEDLESAASASGGGSGASVGGGGGRGPGGFRFKHEYGG